MSIKTILVCLTTKEHASTLLRFAIPLARKHGAHLIGLHTIEALMVYPGIAMHVPPPAFQAFNKSQREEAKAIEDVFRNLTKSEDIDCEWRLVKAEASTASDRMVESARAADLVVMSREDRKVDRFDQSHAQVRVIKESGRPVIIVPLHYEGPEIGQSFLLGWSDTREAARAAHDMLSLADDGADLHILRVGSHDPNEMHDFDGIDLSETFARHGLKVTLDHREKGESSVADVLNEQAFEMGAQLIVTGAFGHSWAYDFVVGAATQELLNNAKLPVLFSK